MLNSLSERTRLAAHMMNGIGWKHLLVNLRQIYTRKDDTCFWTVLPRLYQQDLTSDGACLLLNPCDHQEFDRFAKLNRLWSKAKLRVAIDGAANFLHEIGQLTSADFVCGDLDSIDPKLLTSLRDNSSQLSRKPKPVLIETPDQNETDFTKAIRLALERDTNLKSILATYSSDGSRMDHIFAQVNTLHLFELPIVLFDIKNLTCSWLLRPGRHCIYKFEGDEPCSLIPFLGEAFVRTDGLQYDLVDKSPLRFDGMISTSNTCRYESRKVLIETDKPLFWTIVLKYASFSDAE